MRMIRNKRGITMPGVMIGLILLIIVLVLVAPWFSKTFFGSADTAGSFSVPANAFIISNCKSYCNALAGDDSDVFITTGGDPTYLYCLDEYSFRDAKGKVDKISCSNANVKYKNLKIDETGKCTTLCS